MKVIVYSGAAVVEEKEFKDDAVGEMAAVEFASYWQDEGYKVRIVEFA